MKITKFELHTLNALCDDYESIASIAADLEAVLKRKVPADEIEVALRHLLAEECIDLHEYDSDSKSFQKPAAWTLGFDKYWFSITDFGRTVLDENWSD